MLNEKAAPGSKAMPELAKANVLVVDDDEELAKLVTDFLNQAGEFSAVAESDGFKALAMLEDQVFDLVVLDVMMPAFNGMVVYAILRAHSRTARVPVLFLTAYPALLKMEMLSDPEHAVVLRKPFKADELISTARALVRADAMEA